MSSWQKVFAPLGVTECQGMMNRLKCLFCFNIVNANVFGAETFVLLTFYWNNIQSDINDEF